MSLDANELAARLSRKMGIAFTGFIEQIRGSAVLALRPEDLEVPWGFVLLISQTPREIVATFQLDSFAGRIARQMSSGDSNSRETFDMLVGLARTHGIAVLVEVNGEALNALTNAKLGGWRSFFLECRARCPSELGDQHSAAAILDLATLTYSLAFCLLPHEQGGEVDNLQVDLVEGAPFCQLHQSFERNPIARAIAIQFHGDACQACGMRFADLYGEIGEGFIEVHHTIPLSTVREQHVVNPTSDLIPVCCNCHAMLHRTDPPVSVDDLREFIATLHSSNVLGARSL